MNARTMMIAAAALICASNAATEPTKPEGREAAATTNRPTSVVLASAEQAQTPVPNNSEQAAAPVKRPRLGRVTTCRCGDQTQR